MNIVDGKVLDREESLVALDRLPEMVLQTLAGERLDPGLVIAACDRLSNRLNEEEHLPLLLSLGIDEGQAREQLAQAKAMLSEPYLREKVRAELGDDLYKVREYMPLDRAKPVREQVLPLGVLLHIAAGNAQGLPVFSVIEGLLTGNINILKLPGTGDDISAQLLLALGQIEPRLWRYIYVFDYPSEEVELIKKMTDVADAIVVWGGDAAVRAVRQLASTETKIIEWGHKVSFAYVTEAGQDDEQLTQLARNICATDQLLCNSCQGIFLDTGDMAVVHRFCQRFVEVLARVSETYPRRYAPSLQAQVTLHLRSERIETLFGEKRLYQAEGCSVIACADSDPESSIMFRNPWVKRLPRDEILPRLRRHKNHLQTVALLCGAAERPALAETFSRTGITRVVLPANMSRTYCGAPHDGEYALRRYTKVVSWE